MKRKELYDILKSLSRVKQPGRTFTFVIADNKNRLKLAIEEMEKQKEHSKEYEKFLDEVEDLKRKHAAKDNRGKPKTRQGNFPDGRPGLFYDIPGSEDPESEYRKALAVLEEKNANLIDEQEVKDRKFYEEYLEEDLEKEFEFRKIKYNEVPKDITQEEMDAIFPLLIVSDTDIKFISGDGKK